MAPAKSPMALKVRDLLDRGLVQFALGQREEAIGLWRRALEVAPRDERATDYLASVGAGSGVGGSMHEAVTDEVTPPDAITVAKRPPFTDEMPVYRPDEPPAEAPADDSVITDETLPMFVRTEEFKHAYQHAGDWMRDMEKVVPDLLESGHKVCQTY